MSDAANNFTWTGLRPLIGYFRSPVRHLPDQAGVRIVPGFGADRLPPSGPAAEPLGEMLSAKFASLAGLCVFGPARRQREEAERKDIGVVGDEDLPRPGIGRQRTCQPLARVVQARPQLERILAGHSGKAQQAVNLRGRRLLSRGPAFQAGASGGQRSALQELPTVCHRNFALLRRAIDADSSVP